MNVRSRWWPLVVATLMASPVGASFTLFQHGGAGTAQAGALTARAEGASAVHYNPAALAKHPEREVQLGLDFTAPRDDFESAVGEHSADHVISLAPAFYGSWRLSGTDVPDLAFGLGLDTESWYLVDWDTALFPARFLTRRQELTLFDLHPVIAWGLSSRWSVGAGVHYYRGTLGQGENRRVLVDGAARRFTVEVERLTEATIDGWSVDLALHYATEDRGWGLVVDSGGELDGDGEATYRPRDVPADPGLESNVEERFVPGEALLSFEIPWTARTGFWWAPYPELRLEADLVWSGWSVVDTTSITIRPDPLREASETEEIRIRSWDDTLSVHLGAEGDLTGGWLLSGGLAWVPSPVPEASLEPGFPRGDSIVYALGVAYQAGPYRFDLGYSFHDFDSVTVTGQIAEDPGLESTYGARSQVFSFSLGWSR